MAAAEWGPWWRRSPLHLAQEAGGRQARGAPGHRSASRAVQPCAPPRARRRPAHARARSRQLPSPGAPRRSSATRAGPHTARHARSGLRAWPHVPAPEEAGRFSTASAPQSPCVPVSAARRPALSMRESRRPDSAWALPAPGCDTHNSHFRSPMSDSARPPQRPRGQEGSRGGRRGEQEPGPGPPGRGRGRGGGQVQPPTAVTAVAAASPRDPDGRKRKCLPGARARWVFLGAGRLPPAPAMDCYTANWNPLGDSAFYR